MAAIPAFNEADFIEAIVSKAAKYVDEVIVVDDGSTDNTSLVAKKAGATVIRHEANSGVGQANRTCFELARSQAIDVLVTIDGDGQHNPDEIPALLAPILRGEAELVIGSRFLNNEHNMPGYRRFGIGVITSLWNLGAKVRVTDAQSGFRAYSKKVFETLTFCENGMSISIESLEQTRGKRVIVKEVPISCHYPESSLNLKAVKHGLGVALSVLRIRLKHRLFNRDNRDE